MYADDTQLFNKFDPNDAGEDQDCDLNDCLKEFPEWMRRNHLKLNEAKTEYVIVGTL